MRRVSLSAGNDETKSVMEFVKFSKDPTCYKKYIDDMYKRTHPLYCHIAYYGEIVNEPMAAPGQQWDAVLIPDCPSGRIWAHTRAQAEYEGNLYTRAAGITDSVTFDVSPFKDSLTLID